MFRIFDQVTGADMGVFPVATKIDAFNELWIAVSSGVNFEDMRIERVWRVVIRNPQLGEGEDGIVAVGGIHNVLREAIVERVARQHQDDREWRVEPAPSDRQATVATGDAHFAEAVVQWLVNRGMPVEEARQRVRGDL